MLTKRFFPILEVPASPLPPTPKRCSDVEEEGEGEGEEDKQGERENAPTHKDLSPSTPGKAEGEGEGEGEGEEEGEGFDPCRAEGVVEFRVESIRLLTASVLSKPAFIRNLPW